MKKAPSIWNLRALLKNGGMPDGTTIAQIDGEWVPARPLGYYSLKHRLRCAWLVFTGKGDVVLWPKGQ
jgi:hypothetical protein